MKKLKQIVLVLVAVLGLPLVIPHVAFATDGNVGQVEDFLRNVIKIISGLAGLVATLFIVSSGINYITSSGDPEKVSTSPFPKHPLSSKLLKLSPPFYSLVPASPD